MFVVVLYTDVRGGCMVVVLHTYVIDMLHINVIGGWIFAVFYTDVRVFFVVVWNIDVRGGFVVVMLNPDVINDLFSCCTLM